MVGAEHPSWARIEALGSEARMSGHGLLHTAVCSLDQVRLDALAHLLTGMFPLLRSDRMHL